MAKNRPTHFVYCKARNFRMRFRDLDKTMKSNGVYWRFEITHVLELCGLNWPK